MSVYISYVGNASDIVGVKYIILEAGKTHFKDKDEVWNLYERFYKSFLPEDKFNKNIRRLNQEQTNEFTS